MKSLSKSLIAVLISLAGLQASADDTPVFVSCYADDGAHLQLIFDYAQKQFSYRLADGQYVDTFEGIPSGGLGHNSNVTVSINGDRSHIELTAQIIGGDVIQPIIDTSAKVVFDTDETGSLKMTSHSLYHLSQAYDLSRFHVGVCYVQ